MFKVIAYGKTGFNAVNVPDNETTLNNAASYKKEFPAIDVIQRYFQPKITVKAFEDDVIDIDYIKLVDDRNPAKFAFYSVTGYTMTSGDVAELNVVMDPLLTCGGVDKIDFLDGMTVRHNVPNTGESESFGQYTEDDDYLVPRKVMIAQCAHGRSDSSYAGANDLILTSMYDLTTARTFEIYNNLHFKSEGSAETGYEYEAEEDNATIIKNLTTGDASTATTVESESPYRGGSFKNVAGFAPLKYFHYATTASYNSGVKANIDKLIEAGRSDIILNAYIVPRDLYNDNVDGPNADEGRLQTLKINKIRGVALSDITDFTGAHITYRSLSKIDLSDQLVNVNLKHKRALYGKHFAFTFVSNTSGDSVTLNPELLQPVPASQGGANGYPEVWVKSDLRYGGCPTYYMPQINETSLLGDGYPRSIPATSIKGKPWANADIFTFAASNLLLNNAMYGMNQDVANANTAIQYTQALYGTPGASVMDTPKQAIKNLVNKTDYGAQSYLNKIVGYDVTANYDAAMAAGNGIIADQMFNDLATAAASGNAAATALYTRQAQARQERAQFLTTNIPQVQVLSRSDSGNLPSAEGNGILVYRHYVSSGDLNRFDQILGRYGYKITEKIMKTFMTNCKNFNYIEAKGVSVLCDTVPKSVRDDLSSLFNTGVRIWHKKPSTSTDENA